MGYDNTLPRNVVVTVGTTNTELSEDCYQQRIVFVATNTSTAGQKVTISVGQEAIFGNGVVLSPGGVYQDTADGNYKPANQQINAIADGAGATIAILERISIKKGGY